MGKKRVLVAMSGGVDSAAAAYLLKKQGYDVVGVTMDLGLFCSDDMKKSCGEKVILEAKEVCRQLEIAHSVIDFSKDLQQKVIDDFISEYKKGCTPNPCARCNEYLKFGKLLAYAKKKGFDFLATGHYAKITKERGKTFLRRPKDSVKDQTYFLYCIHKEDLPYILFPLADYTKDEVKDIALKLGLKAAAKRQSQDICFVPGKDYKGFLLSRGVKTTPGEIVDVKGNILGQHKGIIYYTRGQREGLGIAAGKPVYVIDIDAKNNRIVVGEKKDGYSRELIASNINYLVSSLSRNIFAKIRFRHQAAKCLLKKIGRGQKLKVFFDEPQKAITPGQSIVFYDNDVVCGGGIIVT